jgi:ATP-dependent 26S proteasome regulatory subunit
MLGLEDIDSLFKGQMTLSHFLNKVDGFEERNGTLILATTNHPEDIDPALTSRPSRFDRVWIIDNPDQKSRMSYIEQRLTGLCINGLQEAVARATEGFSMAYLKELYVTASMIAIERGLAFPGEQEV